MAGILHTLDEFGISSAGFVFALSIGVFFGIALAFPWVMAPVISWLIALAPAWLPIILAMAFWQLWIRYRRADFIAHQEAMVLEIKIPRDIEKSPRAMELVFAGLSLSFGESTFIDRWWEGGVRPWFSFEVMSDAGRIHFYVWTRRSLRPIVEQQLYAQYPSVEIYEAEDYASRIRYDPDRYRAWGCDFTLTSKDVYPIKTYVDYELDKDPKEEHKIDPISHLFEFLSSLKEGEQVWYQIIIRTNKDMRAKKGAWFAKENRLKGEALDEIAEIKEQATPKRKDKEGNEVAGFMQLTPLQTDKIKAIERTMDKTAYDVGIRAIYVAEKDSYRGVMVPGMLGVFKQFSSPQFNGIKATRGMLVFDYPWQDFRGVMKRRTIHKWFDAYRRRSWFHPPHETKHCVMTTEELATIYHFPSRTVQAPGLDRIPARKFEAPPNLPTA